MTSYKYVPTGRTYHIIANISLRELIITITKHLHIAINILFIYIGVRNLPFCCGLYQNSGRGHFKPNQGKIKTQKMEGALTEG